MDHTGVTPGIDPADEEPARSGRAGERRRPLRTRRRVLGRGRIPLLVSGAAVTATLAAGCMPPPGGGGGGGSTPPPSSSGGMSGLHVSGKSIVNGSGKVVRLLGANRSGSEYACIQGSGFFDGPSDNASIAAMASWKINTVRVPLNEDCWLGINGAPAQYSGPAYRQQIEAFVGRLNAHGMAAVLDLHWNAAGADKSTAQQKMPDADHAPAFWQSVASAFKGNSSVGFDLYNEPHDVSWQCWRNGGDCGVGYKTVGMATLLSTVRATGAKNLVLLGGVGWGGDLSQWLANRPSDPTGNLAASVHTYNFSGCNNASCWNSTIAPVAAVVPVVAGEIGENDCARGYLDQLLPWLDQHGASYLGWGWDTYGCSFPGLISNYNGTPTTFGAGLRDHLRSLAG
jgi:endoglucanase